VPLRSLTTELKRLEAEGAMPIEGLFLLAVGLELGLGLQGPKAARLQSAQVRESLWQQKEGLVPPFHSVS